jgi:hypothetical protein
VYTFSPSGSTSYTIRNGNGGSGPRQFRTSHTFTSTPSTDENQSTANLSFVQIFR